MIFSDYKIDAIDRGVRLPNFHIDQKWKEEFQLEDDVSHGHFLYVLCIEGLRKRGIDTKHKDYQTYISRMKSELATFSELGFESFLLITWDICDYAKRVGIPLGRGRGSAAGSLVLWLIGVTEIDSIKHGLFFERFLSKTRAKFKVFDGVKHYDGSMLMDIDLDIGHLRRSEIVKYVETKYQSQVSKILTVSRFTTKVLVKEVAKAVIDDFQEKDAKILSDNVVVVHGKVYSLDKNIKEVKDFADFMAAHPKVYRICKKLEGLIKHTGSHASAWCLSSSELTQIIPTQRALDKEFGAIQVTAYDMSDVLDLVIKIDLLGLDAVTLIDETCKKIGGIIPFEIPINCPSIYNALQNFQHSYGCFQISGDCAFRTIQQVKPKNLDQLSDVLALARPGSMAVIPQYVDYVTTGNKQSMHPFFDKVFGTTANLCLYQEQCLNALKEIGFDLESAEQVRRCIGKKKREEMMTWEQKVHDKVREKNLPKEVGEVLWKILDNSADYSFNRAHSFSYASLTSCTVWLKFNHPRAFFLTCLEMAKTTEDLHAIIAECRYFSLEVAGPSLTHSENSFCCKNDKIYFGLASIKSVSSKGLEKLDKFRRNFTNKFEVFMAAKEAGISIGVLANLLYVGCLDEFLIETRSKTVLEACCWNLLTEKEKIECLKRGADFQFNLFKLIKALNETIKTEKGKPVIKDSRRDTLRKKMADYLEIYRNNSKHEDFTVFEMESRLLGFSYSQTLQNVYKKLEPNLEEIEVVKSYGPKENVIFVGKVKFAAEGLTKKAGMPYFRCVVADHTTEITCFLYENDRYPGISQHKELNGRLAQEGDVVVVRGQRSGDDIVNANNIAVQEVKVFAKASELPEKPEETDEKNVELAPK